MKWIDIESSAFLLPVLSFSEPNNDGNQAFVDNCDLLLNYNC